AVGDSISRGEIIAEVETDKATMGLEAFEDGVLLEQRVKAGETVPVGTVLGVMGHPEEKPVEPAAVSTVADAGGAVAATTVTPEPPAEVESVRAASPQREKASPVVRRRARELGVDLDTFQGSGPDGRVLLDDLARLAGKGEEEQRTVAEDVVKGEAPAAPARSEPGKVQTPSRIRLAIAKTVTASWREIPQFQVTMEIEMDNAEEVRRELQLSGTPVSVNDMVLKGVSVSLRHFPGLNALFADGEHLLKSEINLGVMVSVDNGLVVPVIKGCEALSLQEIAERSRTLVERARSGTLVPEEMAGGTFSISNLGPQGVSQFSALILPPQVAVLAVGAVCETVIPRRGEPVVARTMRVTLSADHRVVDGAYAAGFLQELRSVLETPVRLLI
ncbi:MAG TPA: dihydrolipoamide acetyltransferase family protein, partial [Geobacteraceae bacterium]|nr:dihydrolipoamide acetyltransferase family protein [Geobacteraceae bacterium]